MRGGWEEGKRGREDETKRGRGVRAYGGILSPERPKDRSGQDCDRTPRSPCPSQRPGVFFSSSPPLTASRTRKKDGRLVIHRTAVPHSDYPRSGVAPPFFFPPPPVGCCAAREGQQEPWLPSPGRMICPTWFVTASAASRSGSRTTPSHCTPRHRIGVDGTRDWSRLPGPVSLQDRRSPEPLMRRRSPLISHPSSLGGSILDRRSRTVPRQRCPKIRSAENLASACLSSAYATSKWTFVDT